MADRHTHMGLFHHSTRIEKGAAGSHAHLVHQMTLYTIEVGRGESLIDSLALSQLVRNGSATDEMAGFPLNG